MEEIIWILVIMGVADYSWDVVEIFVEIFFD